MAKIIQFPVERVRRRTALPPPILPLAWWPFAMSSYLWLYSADAMLSCWGIMGGTGGCRKRSVHHSRAPRHRR
jgi:hypothetical protein